MGQETVELPNPLQQESELDGSAPTSAYTADALLAQLAGAEIDRLLADSDVPMAEQATTTDNPAADAKADVSPGVPTSASLQTISDQLDAMFSVLAETPGHTMNAQDAAEATSTDPAPTAAELDEQIAREAEQLLPQAPRTDDQAALLSANDATGVLLTESPEVEPTIIPSAVTSVASVSNTAALAAAIENDAAQASAVRQALGSVGEWDKQSDHVPLLLLPLVWLNAPFEALGPRTRDALGKIAILTMLNAVAVLIYVLFFKKH